MPVRDEVVRWAIWEADYGAWKPSSGEMTEIFEVAGLGPPSHSDLENFKTRGSNILVGGKSVAWCGIFATYVLKKWGGLNVKWVYGTGIVGHGAVKKVWDYRFMRPGDVAVIRNKVNSAGQYLHHHFIVTDISYSGNEMDSVDGNSTGNKIVWHTGRKIKYSGTDSNFLKRPYCYYQLLA